MASKSVAGEYCAQAVLSVTESAANTLTFDKLETGLSVYDKVGWVIARVEWRLGATTPGFFNSSGDLIAAALVMSNQLTALNDTDPAVQAIRKWSRLDIGTAASGLFFPTTWVDDYSTLPGGGLLVLPNPLYLAVLGTGLSAAGSCTARIFYRAIDMGQDDYFNLIQARQLLING